MPLISFPRTDEETREPTLYDKVYNVASSVLSSFHTDSDHGARTGDPNGLSVPEDTARGRRSRKPSEHSAQKVYITGAHTEPEPIQASLAARSAGGTNPRTSSSAGVSDRRDKIEASVDAAAAAAAGRSSGDAEVAKAAAKATTCDAVSSQVAPGGRSAAKPQPITASVASSGSGAPTITPVSSIAFGSFSASGIASSAASIASVGVSSEHAVPLLPTSTTNTPTTTTLVQSNDDQSAFDVESLFSVSSHSASREYLASQYSRSRSRAQPSRLSREYWMKDESASSCFSCNRSFTTFRRKHHCRVCGQIFCAACTSLIEGERCGSQGRVRCCRACEDALALHSSSDDDVDASFVSQAPFDTDSHSAGGASGLQGYPIPGAQSTQVSDRGVLIASSGTSSSLIASSLDESHRFSASPKPFPSLRDDNNESYSLFTSATPLDDSQLARSFLGSQHAVRNRSRSHTLREDSEIPEAIAQAATPVSVSAAAAASASSNSTSSAPAVIGSIGTQSSILNNSHNSGINSSTNNCVALGTPASNSAGNASAFAKFPNSATVELNNAARTYLLLFLEQLLRDSELNPEEWRPVLTRPLLEVAAGIHLELNDRLSPREWVKIKRVPGGKPSDIDCICGTCFTHQLARRSMPTHIKQPRILIITFPLEYTRLERYLSLEPVIAQEKEYLRKLIARIAALKPNILLSCSHVCGKAMDMLEQHGISVAQNVRESALFRLSRVTNADILASIDRLSSQPQLGSCELFEQRSYRMGSIVKSFLFFFVKHADPGRCALVRGDAEISGVIKVVLEVMAEICYSLKAETALMRDQLVNVPNITDPSPLILSSSPFVDYGVPFLQRQLHLLEDTVVQLGDGDDSANSEDEKLKPTNAGEVEEVDGSNAAIELEEQQYNEKKRAFKKSALLESTRSRWLHVARLWEGIESSYPFMFNPSSHQNLFVLYSLVCNDTATPCVGPDPQLIEFYLNTDQTLGKFVESTIGSVGEICHDGCEHPLLSHSKKFINGSGMVTASVEPMACKVSGLEDCILMWSYCKKCDQNMPIAPMSSTTWKYSMGKYLELSLYGEMLKMRASTCDHNVYRDHIRYFAWHGFALAIEYTPIVLHEISGPPAIMRYNPESEVQMKDDAYSDWQTKLDKFWKSLLESLSNVKVEGLEQDMIDLSQQKLVELKSKAETDWMLCNKLLRKLHVESEPNDYLALNKIIEFYQQLVDKWHSDLGDFDGQFFPTERDIRRVTALHLRGLLGDDTSERKTRSQTQSSGHASNDLSPTPSANTIDSSAALEKSLADAPKLPEQRPDGMRTSDGSNDEVPQVDDATKSLSHDSNSGDTVPSSTVKKSIVEKAATSTIAPSTPDSKPLVRGRSSPSVSVKSRFGNKINLSMPELQTNYDDGEVSIVSSNTNEMNLNTSNGETALEVGGGTDSNAGTNSATIGRVSFLAKHFEELSREFERERQREKQRLKDRQRAFMTRHAHTVAEVFEDVTDEVEDWPHQGKPAPDTSPVLEADTPPQEIETVENGEITPDESCHHATTIDERGGDNASVNLNSARCTTTTTSTTSSASSIVENDAELPQPTPQEEAKEDEENHKAEPAKMSLIKSLANFWSERSSTRWNGIEYVLGINEHFFSNSNVVLRESEPSSLIAFCLSLPDYQSRINEFYESTPGVPPTTTFENEDNTVLEQAMMRQTGTHMRYYFDRSTVKASCKIFFSEQFDALRRKCMVSDNYIQSLSRCSTWDSLGGKSGSAFLKTLDDRLILKELSHAEFDSFINFAPSYFEYMAQALFHDLPTVLSKIFGVYQIIIKSTHKSQPVKMYVLVMENLFYGRKFDKFFDLKGSMRNRKVTETGKANEVLLDENMVEYIYDTPVFVREHCKRMLRASLYNDTLFLTKMNVMDYSLVIGLDDKNNTIVAGIIDYIRTYTWDKKVESWVKARAATSNIKEPTVVSPKQYKGRFRESMERYFVMVPDCWSQPIN